MKQNIYIVLHTLAIGGAERHASSIANYLSNNGYKVTIILLDNKRVEYDLSDGINVVSLPELKSQKSKEHHELSVKYKILLKTLRKFSTKKYSVLDKYLYLKTKYADTLQHYFQSQPDISSSIVISFMPIPNLTCSIIKKRIKYKLILGEFSAPQLEFPPDAPENQLKRMYFPYADTYVFQTDEQRQFYSFLPKVNKLIIPNPLEDIKVQPYHGERKKEIVNFCRLVDAKNLPLLIDAFSLLAAEYPDYTLIIYGDGPEKKRLLQQIDSLGLSDKALIRPYEKNILEHVRKSAMFVSSSNREGISNSMLESMAIGLPAICTECPAGGAKMFINSYVNGITVPVQDPNAMYQAMKYIIDHPDKATAMSNNSVNIRTILDKNKIMEKWLKLIQEI